MKNFYITTPIYYVNDEPHIGHAYTTILADVLTRYHRLFGDRSFFLTGLDEHGQKVQEAAVKRGVSPQEHCDQMSARFTGLWKKLEITNDDFIRTTEVRHQAVVKKVLQELYDQGQIYPAEYDGWYCTPDERFWTEKDIKDGNCPDCGRPVSKITEKNYFFKMSQHQQWLIDEITSGRMTIKPETRKNEVLGFLKKPLNDLCISRPKKRLAWGIELPFDHDYVTYVWFDALINYISALGYHSPDDGKYQEFWPSALHLLGKDILTTHSVYWPTMLHAMKVKTPQTILAHGWWLVGDTKMSKSLGNVVKPLDLVDKYGVDPFRYFLMRDMTLGADSIFSEASLVMRINSDLANDFGNLASRVLKMINSYCEGKIPSKPNDSYIQSKIHKGLIEETNRIVETVKEHVECLDPNKAIESIIYLIKLTNRYIHATEPWKLHKGKKYQDINTILYVATEVLHFSAVLLSPVMPQKCGQLLTKLGVEDKDVNINALRWGHIKSGHAIGPVEQLFPKIGEGVNFKDFNLQKGFSVGLIQPLTSVNKDEGKKNMEENKILESGTEKSEIVDEDLIDIDYFKKIKLRTAEIISAEKVPNADKLLRLQVKLGQETRQVLAGIAQWYTPESLVGQQVVIVANLKPAKIRGLESHGMLLAAQDKDGVVILNPQRKTDPGSEVR
ncbi:MAG: methionine--tRNA ligase [Candidatus Edwardsbacteria bacterium]|nr:methionine--tRNA ligase [Candidatus Edwardsbacteria bacterium]MBU1575834.1 methionine--tRNA ligase [Candidatus Edwardsbacteria bacterium]MBU2463620.1 methionine--tRNA ligase [Candidatus Edwardsbacteria bacterium]MBU2593048.1 methionine--tRNA ligase [Candidatus Edwardsbacteria bacterium]